MQAARASMRPPHDEEAARAEKRKGAGAKVVIAFYRLVKACQLYDGTNEAVQSLVAPVVEAVEEFLVLYETDLIRVLFSRDQVYINRKMMRAPRETFALALQLGSVLQAHEFNEVTFERGVSADVVRRVSRMLIDGQRDRALAAALKEPMRGLSLRQAVGPDADVNVDPDETAIARVVKSYAASILILQSFHQHLASGDARGASDIKRIAQKLVALSEKYPELLVATAAGALPDDDPGRRAVSTAVIALSMARILTQDRSTLTTLVQAALLADAGTARHSSARAADEASTNTVAVLTTIGEFHPASVRRCVVAFEALRMQGALAVNPRQLTYTVLARLLSTARKFNELRTPTPGNPRPTLDAAARQMENEAVERLEKACVRLLVSALGFYPPGTLVELDSGELALITGVPAAALDFARPPVQLVSDARKQVLPTPVELDLARQPAGQRTRTIKRTLDLDRMRAAR
jgi:hypothetical protein